MTLLRHGCNSYCVHGITGNYYRNKSVSKNEKNGQSVMTNPAGGLIKDLRLCLSDLDPGLVLVSLSLTD